MPSTFNQEVTPELERIVRRCLAKPLGARLQSAADLRIELEEASQIQSPAPTVARNRYVPDRAFDSRVAFLGLRFKGRAPQGEAFRLVNPQQVTFDAGVEDYPTWSPDGRTLAYHSNRDGNWDIWIAQLGGGEPLNRTAGHTGADRYPSWSPDGQQIAYARDDGIFVMSPLAGAPAESGVVSRLDDTQHRLVERLATHRLPDRVSSAPPFMVIVTLETGETTRIPFDASDVDSYDVSWSVDGRLIAFRRLVSRQRCHARGYGEPRITREHATGSPSPSSLTPA